MTAKSYDWEGGAILEPHTKKKHKVLKEYFRQYLITRCQLPQQNRFRLVVVDGFAGGGLYECGSYGSPLIFVDVLLATATEINTTRAVNGLGPINIECLLLLNDYDRSVVELLKKNIAPLLVGTKEESSHTIVEVEFYNGKFEYLYWGEIKSRILRANCRNVFFNLDQCGYSNVTSPIIRDIIFSWKSAEIILTFMIASMLAYLSPKSGSSGVPLEPEIKAKIDALLHNNQINKKEWLAESEKVVFEFLKGCAPFVSPFSINNHNGWQYWLMHFASSYRARQVYNNVLHLDCDTQAHFGRSGLHMLSYDPQYDGQLYLFDDDSRKAAKEELYDDIPRLVGQSGDVLLMGDFYEAAYSETPAHSEDIHEMIMENPDLEVITSAGGERQKAHTIKVDDTLRLKSQRSMFFLFSGKDGDH
ncbi:MAG: three-Cys-motif partner protein TcmP [Pseudomonadales bacterium]|nr:three-Cys-motif partner protein TcmP [Pseudomonadales bacterium]